MKHLITGGSGFLGNLIMQKLLEQSEEVKILDIWKSDNLPKNVEFIECSVLDRDGVNAAMNGIDIVHHNAAQVPLTKAGKDFWKVNKTGSQIVAEEALRSNVKGFIHMSSSAVFGDVDSFPINDKTLTKPIEIYGRSKLAGENAVKSVLSKSDIPLIVIRPRTILGEGRLGIFQILFEWISENKNVYVIGSGNELFQFVHAHDLMDAYMLAYKKGVSATYNVGTDSYKTLREAIENVVSHAKSNSKVISLPTYLSINILRFADWLGISPLAPFHYLTYHKPYCFDMNPLINIGWNCKYSNDKMLTESYDWFKKNKNNLVNINNKASVHRKPVKEAILKLVKWIS
jgi:nucleoside-diphosphate-sugar epimerase